MLVCKYCNSEEFHIVEVDNVHRFKTVCSKCKRMIKWGKPETILFKEGNYKAKIIHIEEVNNRFLYFKFKLEDSNILKKKVWSDGNGYYMPNLKKFIKFIDNLPNNLQDLILLLKDKNVIIKIQTIARNNVRNSEITSLKL